MWQQNEMCCLRVCWWTYHSLLTAIKILFSLYAAEQQEHELLGIPSVSSVLPMAHQSALVANATHPSHAMFAAATLGHHGMFDSNLGAQDGKFSLFDFQQHFCVWIFHVQPPLSFSCTFLSLLSVCVRERGRRREHAWMYTETVWPLACLWQQEVTVPYELHKQNFTFEVLELF